jgi:hypothetical protein
MFVICVKLASENMGFEPILVEGSYKSAAKIHVGRI